MKKKTIKLNESNLRKIVNESVVRILKESAGAYDYETSVREDVYQYIKDSFDQEEIIEGLKNRDNWAQELYDDMFVSDNVTGNGSGSYWFNYYKAEEALAHNMQLYFDALKEFGDGVPDSWSPEAADVTIRCHLLYPAIDAVLDELEDEFGSVDND